MPNTKDTQPPQELDGAQVVCFAFLDNLVASGGTTHRIAGEVQADFSGLCIAQYPGEDNHYLFYCDSDWSVVTDTVHLNMSDAKQQAEYEYSGVSEHWIDFQSTDQTPSSNP